MQNTRALARVLLHRIQWFRPSRSPRENMFGIVSSACTALTAVTNACATIDQVLELRSPPQNLKHSADVIEARLQQQLSAIAKVRLDTWLY
jgi:hypothetical protein